ncbi:MAG: methyltransferase domain-containing protein [Candidatus Methylacidiphilales bacterium]|nr:methyltransferase domain-containing protein [Candidatus Methylacidiphilales bacterium]
MNGYYESPSLLGQYLLLHYGRHDEVLGWPDGPAAGLDFPGRCAARLGRALEGRRCARFLDLGCAVGRSTFEALRWADEAVGLDYSAAFIAAAVELSQAGRLPFPRLDEGLMTTALVAEVPPDLPRERARFVQGDACSPAPGLGKFGAVLLANLLCRLPDPGRCLRALPSLVEAGGVVMITTPCSWMEAFTPQDRWLGGVDAPTLDGIRREMEPAFQLLQTEEMPFLIREHARKFQWSVAQASFWRRG